ncbi:ribosome biogenesis protein NOP53 [Frankliniella occidentalis]|uniref:Ribosome biogenesis protein NOP53 n=1 Tax=Frankliniella occidentalis TaxID=133901 RepID=A0A6J1SX46_FRAOC|nr:ribosome biogenesis protein NOP53 [Frankliniella occidentalis]
MAVGKVKKRQGSKKTKKAWRKTDIQDVEDFLEDKRLEERLGVAFEDRQDHELFTVDTVPDQKGLDKFEDWKKERRNEILKQPPRCYQALLPDSKVPDPISKRNRIRTAEERKHPLLRKKEAERIEKGILKAKDLDRQRNRILDEKRRKSRPAPGDFSKDLWDESNISSALAPELGSEWLEPSVKKHVMINSDLKDKIVRSKLQCKPHNLPAVEVPHPGMSYNPSFDDHINLLKEISDKEQKLIKEDEHIKRVTTLMFKKLPRGVAEAQWIKEMSEGVPVLDPEAAKLDEEDDNDNEYRAINPPTDRDKKKDRKTRRKAIEEKRKQVERQMSKLENKKVSDLYRLRKLKEDISKAEAKSAKLKDKRIALRAKYATKTKRLGRNKFEERETDFNLASELKGNLRSLKPEGNLLADRFVNLQKRNIMEVAARQNPRRAKIKKFFKSSHKMAWEVTPLQRQLHERKKLQRTNHVTLGAK